ncbi:MAG: hypothetical protein J2P25_15920 [Nocardiopsaceae bacterium]|nr:hypothetical protein [Nocardiopsaceae bacterium]
MDGNGAAAAGLADEVEELRRLVGTLRSTVTRWDAKLKGEAGAVLSLRLDLKHLGEKVDRIQAQVTGHRPEKAPPAPRWDDLDQADEAAQLAALREWVNGMLRLQYPDYALPRCWEAHRTALWELGTLHAEWKQVYDSPDGADPEAAMIFHDRWLPGVLNRLNKAIPCDEAGCRAARQATTRQGA